MATIGPALKARLGLVTDTFDDLPRAKIARPEAARREVRRHETFEVNVFLKAEPAPATDEPEETGDRPARRQVVKRLTSRGHASRQRLVADLQGWARADVDFADDQRPTARNIQQFWISNAVGVEVTRDRLDALLKRSDIEHIELNRHTVLEELLDATPPFDRAAANASGTPTPATDEPEPTWSVKRVGAPLLWQQGLTGDGVVVAVLDTGVNYNHPDLMPNMWDGGAELPRHGFDFASNDTDPRDDHGHGTACAGIVAGSGAQGQLTGVAPAAKIMALRVGVEERNFWRGLQFAIERDVDVISMSMTWKFDSSPDYPGWRRVSEGVLRAGIPHANSGGNQGTDLAGFPIPFNIGAPGNCPSPRGGGGGRASPITCGNTDDADRLEASSGRGPCGWDAVPFDDYPWANGTQPGLVKPDLCAPGRGSTTCDHRFPDDPTAKPYRQFGGTSAATPHVAGCLALLVHACKKAGTPAIPERLQEALEETAVPIAGQTQKKENHFGAGRVDVFAAWQYGKQRGWW